MVVNVARMTLLGVERTYRFGEEKVVVFGLDAEIFEYRV